MRRCALFGFVLLAGLLAGCGGGGSTSPSSVSQGTGNAGGNSGGPSYSFLYAIDYTERTVDAFRVDSKAATLTTVAGSPFNVVPDTDYPGVILADPLGRFLYVVDNGQPQILGGGEPLHPSIRSFKVDRGTGKLTLTGVVTDRVATRLISHPDGRTIYVVVNGNYGGLAGSIQSYAVDQATGELTPGATTSLPSPNTIVSSGFVEPLGRYLFTVGPRTFDPYDQGASIVTYAISGNGLVKASTFEATPHGELGPGPFAVTKDFVFLASDGYPAFQSARINSDGSLTRMYDSFTSGDHIALGIDALVVSSDGKSIYFHNTAFNTLEYWSVDDSGRPRQVSKITVGTYLPSPQLLLSKDRRALFVMNYFRTLLPYAVDASGNIQSSTGSAIATTDKQQWLNMVLVE